MSNPDIKRDQRLQVGYGSAWHLLRCLGWQKQRFSEMIGNSIGGTNVEWLDFPAYAGDMIYPRGNPILDGEWQRLEFLGVNHPLQREYDQFWPHGGAQQSWDAIGTADFDGRREWLLVEAKAHIGEINNAGTGATNPNSLQMIRAAFDKTQRSLACDKPVEIWLTHYYQFANRLSTLYFLNEHVPECSEPARIIMLYFCGDTYAKGDCPSIPDGWHKKIQEMNETLGVAGLSELEQRVHTVYVNVDLANCTQSTT